MSSKYEFALDLLVEPRMNGGRELYYGGMYYDYELMKEACSKACKLDSFREKLISNKKLTYTKEELLDYINSINKE